MMYVCVCVCVLWQAVIVSEQKIQEAERLKAAIETLLQEAGQRTLREVCIGTLF